jgi:hypothetical protein
VKANPKANPELPYLVLLQCSIGKIASREILQSEMGPD